jgi:hypothetical protein
VPEHTEAIAVPENPEAHFHPDTEKPFMSRLASFLLPL